jgi:hypothetical protein
MGMHMSSLRLSLLTALLCLHAAHAETRIGADPDFICSGYSWSGVAQLSLGDLIAIKGISLGGMVVIRNEARLNQGLLPNHSWRGFVHAGYRIAPAAFTKRELAIVAAFEHESTHPTMGIEEPPHTCYDMVYDGSYRRYLLNSLLIRIEKSWTLRHFVVMAKIDYQFYFFSKNTPELATQTPAQGNGVSLAAEARVPIRRTYAFVSVFDRCIARGHATDVGEVHFNSRSGIVGQRVRWPIMAEMNTVVVKAGYAVPIPKLRRTVSVSGSLLYGNVFGFVDSRERRTVWSMGVALSH